MIGRSLGREGKKIYPVNTSATDIEAAVGQYASQIRKIFQLGEGDYPAFDLCLLGMGADGHVASLFPGAIPDTQRYRLTAATHAPQGPSRRITLTMPVFNHAKTVFILVTGEQKAHALKNAVEGKGNLPAGLVNPLGGTCLFLADVPAASLLPKELCDEA